MTAGTSDGRAPPRPVPEPATSKSGAYKRNLLCGFALSWPDPSRELPSLQGLRATSQCSAPRVFVEKPNLTEAAAKTSSLLFSLLEFFPREKTNHTLSLIRFSKPTAKRQKPSSLLPLGHVWTYANSAAPVKSFPPNCKRAPSNKLSCLKNSLPPSTTATCSPFLYRT